MSGKGRAAFGPGSGGCSPMASFSELYFCPLTCPQLCLVHINRTLMEMPVDLSKDIDDHSTIILIISLQEEMKGRGPWLFVMCHSKACTAKTSWLNCSKAKGMRWKTTSLGGDLQTDQSGNILGFHLT